MKFLRNCWYMAGWSSEFSATDIVPFTIMDEPLAIYRKEDGTLAALEDLCPHRLAPLTVGRKEGDELRCMYHGLKFAADGRCTEIPGQERISSKVCVRSYPIEEKHGAAWVWMGDAEKADVSLIPPISGPDSTEFAMVCAKFVMKGNAELVADNLLDLSHAPFIHESTFGASNMKSLKLMKEGETKRGTAVLERGVRADRWHAGRQSNPYFGEVPSDDRVISTFLVPGVFILTIHSYAPGVQDRLVDGEPAEEPIFRRCTCQMITPINDTESMFFYNFGPGVERSDLKEHAFAIADAAFAEDKAIIEAQQATIKKVPGRKMIMLAMDQPVLRYNEIYDGLRTKEAAEAAQAPAAAV
ncbi:aromatic ring-hydroxylating dioxygenase subunit alpha [Paraburkholderia rhynchosiae]|uniref:Toluene-4-sulfonate monooxygenase system iron-sulfur subunit TsaM1 n=2 Tax=Paraburkholderia rhynchosiae TaxID=487049 RepID=A0A6J5C399_9BURK|nr:aromatic ring-hydroxylating dioxygenase subunit alpha [Paraburkholderia rhynchosiae]CAB3723565.1 Toluene-4-sulfonate monooxygenase system iron-sulfur subunit TsaM1 [Paraburkholderia rhynchosiae]